MNHLVLINHDTLTLQHLEVCIYSISDKNQPANICWDSINIYNSCSYISNDEILSVIESHSLKYNVLNILEVSDIKTLNSDLNKISIQMTNVVGNLLFLKCDYSVSKNLFEILKTYEYESNFLYSLPVINAKEFVTDKEIRELLKDESFTVTNDITYYRGSDLFPPLNEMSSSGLKDTDAKIKFVSWGGSLDYNVHLISSDVLHYFDGQNHLCTWGGCISFKSMKARSVIIKDEKRCFCVHKYHDIISKNNSHKRGDLRKVINGQRY